MRIGVMMFSTLVPLQLPSRMQTHLWYMLPNEVKSESLLKHYTQLLSQSEKDSISGMQSDELKKKNALLARTLVRTTIARYHTNNKDNTLVDPRSLKFKKNVYACGITVNAPVGIDVEDKTRKTRHDALSLSKRFYSSREVKFLSSIADAEAQRKEFIKLWTLKEAYVKALGKGFSASPFDTFSIIRSESGSYNLNGKAEERWKFRLLELAASSHYAAICIGGEDEEQEEAMNVIVHRTIPFVEDELISDWKLL
ncbi:4'-phosphopantetheinyl transferase domain-containing protein [Hirschfeldia incana]|nr:4'-phosphopantetheinyl transferase domain-containing protein [Hirschfeldia incana]